MTTKEYHNLPIKGIQNLVISDPSNSKYSNLNLNQINRNFSNAFSGSSNNAKIGERKVLSSDDFAENNDLQKSSHSSWNKSTKELSRTFANNDFEKEDIFKKRNATKSAKNSSTLSLQIAAYENLMGDNLFDREKEGLRQNGLIKKRENAKEIFMNSVIQNPFEFSRQQNEELSQPEVSQFKASQRLHNPNQMNQKLVLKMGKFKPKFNNKKKKPARVLENAPPQQDEDAFNMEDMIEEVDPSQLVGLERKAFKRKATDEESEDSDEGDEEEVLVMPKKKQKKEKKQKELVVEEEKEENVVEEANGKEQLKSKKKKQKKPKELSNGKTSEETNATKSPTKLNGTKTSKKPKKKKQKKPKSKKPAVGDKIIESSEDEGGDAEEKPSELVKKGKKPGIKDPETANLDMSAWSQFILPPEVLEGLRKMRYTKPTPIQEMSLPAAILKRQDLLGAAETGSGKTMAFCIPIATRLVENDVKDGLRALILAPTRELVVQIYKEMEKLLEFTQFSVIPVVGGLSQQKQERLLNRKPSVIVATPGRFWTLLEATDYLQDLSQLDFVVIDEIDRMVETGHFAEMEMILSKIHAIENKSRQTLVFSATLSFVHIPINRPGKNAMKLTKEEKIEKLVQIGGLRKQHKVIDLNESAGTPSSLIEARMNCSDLLDKDSKVYYLLKRYSGRTLIFTNSIDASRRLFNLLKTMDVVCELLHAKMQQRARIKHLERFSSTENSVLIATDVAARGLDIKGIENVIHYQIPRSAENYVHRSGRTARIFNKGVAILLVDPTEVNLYRKLCHNLHKDNDFPVYDIDSPAMYKACVDRMYAATKAEQLEHRITKLTSKRAWESKAAEEAEIVLEKMTQEEQEVLHSYQREKKAALNALKVLLRQPFGKNVAATAGTPSSQPLLTRKNTTKLLRKRRR